MKIEYSPYLFLPSEYDVSVTAYEPLCQQDSDD